MKKETAYTILAAAFCVCLIASNIFETVIFNAGPIALTGGFLVFPIIYIINDCLSEVYGYKKTQSVILLAFVLNFLFLLSAQVVARLPESPMSAGLSDGGISPQQHFTAVFNADLRITVASMAAFVAGSLVNARVMVAMRDRHLRSVSSDAVGEVGYSGADVHESMKGFGLRAILSSLAGESLDSLVFFPIAFHAVGFKPMLVLMGTQIVLKTAYEIAVLPLTTFFVRRLKSIDCGMKGK